MRKYASLSTSFLQKKIRQWFKSGEIHGFGLMEVIIALLLTSVLFLGAYKLFIASAKKGTETVAKARSSVAATRYSTRLATELANIVALPTGMGTETWGSSTKLRNFNPAGCSETYGLGLPGGVVPYPAHSKEDMDARNNLAPIDPSYLPAGDQDSDAIRFAYLPSDSEIFPLSTTPNASGTPLPSLTIGNNPIHLEASPLELTGKLAVGDFAIISDGKKSDIFRITSILPHQGGTRISHDPNLSIWNQSFGYNFGREGASALSGRSFIRKVEMATYAHGFVPGEDGKPEGRIFRDSHQHDDGFVGGSYPTVAFPELTHHWDVVARGIDRLYFEYAVKRVEGPPNYGILSGKRDQIRNPRAGRSGLGGESGDCYSQLASPLLELIRPRFVVAGDKEYVRQVSPTNLKNLGQEANSSGGVFPRSLGATPIPTPAPFTPTPDPNSTATPLPTATALPPATPHPTVTPGGPATATPNPTATPEPTNTPLPTATPVPTATPAPTNTPASSPTPGPTSTPQPTVTPGGGTGGGH